MGDERVVAVPIENCGQLGGLFGAIFGVSDIFRPLLGANNT
ncbi:hypothetical protein [Paenibacillus sp. L3-i20]|nr:hypothetical protein [Paenibacillus sp. L3-i20]